MSLLVIKAVAFAEKAHRGQVRKYTGAPYLIHLLEVAALLAEADRPEHVVAAGLLHDSVEDTKVEYEDLVEEFGVEVADLVMQVTEVSTKADGNRAVRKAKDREHYAKGSYDGMSIKLADLLSNGADIVENDPNFARQYLKEMSELHPLLNKGNARLWMAADKMLREFKEKGLY